MIPSPAAQPSPWTALLESLHSTLIDEITERHPEPKAELGLPLRQTRFALPSTHVEELLLIETAFGESNGVTVLALEVAFLNAIGLSASGLWGAMLERARPEFLRRGIDPQFTSARELRASDPLPPSTSRCTRVIWIPIRLPSGECVLGMGISVQ